MYIKSKTKEEELKEANDRRIEIVKLINESPLYKTIELNNHYPHDLLDLLERLHFNFYCEDEKQERTFHLHPDGNIYRPLAERIKDKVGLTLNEAALFVGVCSGCNSAKVYFAFHIHGKLPRRPNGELQPSTYLRKIGQLPAYTINADRDILDHLKEDAGHYKKALICISQSYGIAAYAYFRRILENEIKRIATNIIELKVQGSQDVEASLNKYYSNHQMSPLIDSIADHLPKSMMIDTQNPIKLLYKFYSEAIHSMSEEDCLSKAMALNKILVFVIRQLKKEASEYNEVKEAMRDLNKMS